MDLFTTSNLDEMTWSDWERADERKNGLKRPLTNISIRFRGNYVKFCLVRVGRNM